MSHSLSSTFSDESDSSDDKETISNAEAKKKLENKNNEVKSLSEVLFLLYKNAGKYPKELRDSVDPEVYLIALDFAKTTTPFLTSEVMDAAGDLNEVPKAMFWPFHLLQAVYESQGEFTGGLAEACHYGGHWPNDTVDIEALRPMPHVPTLHLFDIEDEHGPLGHLKDYGINLLEKQIEQHDQFLIAASRIISREVLNEPEAIQPGLIHLAIVKGIQADPACFQNPMKDWLPQQMFRIVDAFVKAGGVYQSNVPAITQIYCDADPKCRSPKMMM